MQTLLSEFAESVALGMLLIESQQISELLQVLIFVHAQFYEVVKIYH